MNESQLKKKFFKINRKCCDKRYVPLPFSVPLPSLSLHIGLLAWWRRCFFDHHGGGGGGDGNGGEATIAA